MQLHITKVGFTHIWCTEEGEGSNASGKITHSSECKRYIRETNHANGRACVNQTADRGEGGEGDC